METWYTTSLPSNFVYSGDAFAIAFDPIEDISYINESTCYETIASKKLRKK